jgi:hypothetical protein
MNRATLSSFRAQWPDEAMGICQADAKVRNYANEAQERLLMDPSCPDEGWWGGWITMNLTAAVSSSVTYVTTPREISRLVDVAVCQNPIHMRNGFYEYLKYGSGLQPKTCPATCAGEYQGYDRDNVCTLFNLNAAPAKTIRIFPTDARDAGRRVLLQGKDANGQVVLTTDPGTAHSAPGEYLLLAFPFVDSVNQYTAISGIQKDETYGPIQFFQVDPVTLLDYPLSTMEPTESTASYRRYLLAGVLNLPICCTGNSTTIQITAQGRLDFIPVVNETDYLSIPNVPALIEEAMSLRFNKMDSTASNQQSMLHHIRALNLLFGQLDKYVGKTQTAVKIPLFGTNRMRPSFR